MKNSVFLQTFEQKCEKVSRNFAEILRSERGQKHVNIVDLVKSFPTNIYLQNLASIQKRTSLVKFAHLAEKSGNGSISNLSTKVQLEVVQREVRRPA